VGEIGVRLVLRVLSRDEIIGQKIRFSFELSTPIFSPYFLLMFRLEMRFKGTTGPNLLHEKRLWSKFTGYYAASRFSLISPPSSLA